MTSSIASVLWKDIEDFEIGLSEASLTFTDRLARENGWDIRFAERVVEEYRRFTFLAMTAGHPVTPSEQVDQAWHLHLLYTENYWTEFCGQVLGRPFHHGPTRGGPEEGSKFHDWYQATLDSYERAFGETAPPNIWPDARARFLDAHRFRRINTASHWVIPKPKTANLRAWSALLLPFPILAACVLATDQRGELGLLYHAVQLAFPVVFVGYLAFCLRRWLTKDDRRDRNKGGSGHGGGCGGGGCGNSGCGGGGCGGCGG